MRLTLDIDDPDPPLTARCFGGGGGGGTQYIPPPPPPPTNVPTPPGSDAFQRFQEIRQGLLTGQTQLIQPPSGDTLGSTKGTNLSTDSSKSGS